MEHYMHVIILYIGKGSAGKKPGTIQFHTDVWQTLSPAELQEVKNKEKYLDRTVISATMKIMLRHMTFGRNCGKNKKIRELQVEGKNYLMQSETN